MTGNWTLILLAAMVGGVAGGAVGGGEGADGTGGRCVKSGAGVPVAGGVEQIAGGASGQTGEGDLRGWYPWLPEKVEAKAIPARSRKDMERLRGVFLAQIAYGYRMGYGTFADLRREWTEWGWEDGKIEIWFPQHKAKPAPGSRDFVNEVAPQMRKIASAYFSERGEAKREAARMFVVTCRQLMAKGFRHGPESGITIEDGGYTLRHFAPAVFAMREELEAAGILDAMAKAVAWQSMGCEMVKREPSSTCDHFNNFSVHLPLAVLLIADEAERYQWMRCVKRFYDEAIAAREVPFGEDGSIHHHWGHHLAYGGYAPLTLMKTQLIPLKGTEFAAGGAALEKLKAYVRACVAQSRAGMTPPNVQMRAGVPGALGAAEAAWLCGKLAGGDNAVEMDREMAGLYLRACGGEVTEQGRKLLAAGMRAEPEDGHMAIKRAGISTHSRAGWMAAAAAQLKKYRSLEVYGWLENNNYGRLARNGTLFLTVGGETGWRKEGWDHNHWPAGTNAVFAPEELLEGYAMFSGGNDRTGGVALDLDGVWGTDFDAGGVKFRKSVTCFGHALVVLTDGIESGLAGRPVVTTLFQQAMINGRGAQVGDGLALDTLGNGYVLLDGATLKRRTGEQEWTYFFRPYLKDPQNNPCLDMRKKKFREQPLAANAGYYHPTRGEFETVWFEHGVEPRGAGCRYIIMMQPGVAGLEQLREPAAAIRGDIEILKCDAEAHVVRRKSTGQTGYVVFRAGGELPGPVRRVDRPCWIFAREDAGGEARIAVEVSGFEPGEVKVERAGAGGK